MEADGAEEVGGGGVGGSGSGGYGVTGQEGQEEDRRKVAVRELESGSVLEHWVSRRKR